MWGSFIGISPVESAFLFKLVDIKIVHGVSTGFESNRFAVSSVYLCWPMDVPVLVISIPRNFLVLLDRRC